MPQSTDQSPHFQTRWHAYYQAVDGRPPRSTLLKALDLFEAEPNAQSDTKPSSASRLAVDLGCGDGRDTVEIVRRGWRVLAIDGEEVAIARLLSRSDIDQTRLETRVQRFEDLDLPDAVDLINASFCLPFCPPSYFEQLWHQIQTALVPGGRFCGQLFGDRDSWAVYDDIAVQTRTQVEAMLQPFTVELFEEEEHPGKTALGDEKHWHLFQIVARKNE
jgi:SAM-dependent methyltransferase